MKIPITPPCLLETLPISDPRFEKVVQVMLMRSMGSKVIQATQAGEYLHWDALRHRPPPLDLSPEEWWAAIKISRRELYKYLPFANKHNKPFVLATPDIILQNLHQIDRNLGNTIPSSTPDILNQETRDTYLISSLIQEAITSSQLEGASTTRKVAKEMLRMERKPRTLDEKMIFNNYQAMQFIHTKKNQPLTVRFILELHHILTQDTGVSIVGALRTSDDIHVAYSDQIVHIPPLAKTLSERLEKICNFANTVYEQSDFFIHPILKAILLHFILAYDHPFVDGNGRTARALFYWSMLHQGYWLTEFISISEVIKQAPTQYARAYLYTETDDNDVTYFIIHQLEVIKKAIKIFQETVTRQSQEINAVERLLSTHYKFRNKLNYRQIDLIKHALKHPKMRYYIKSHQQAHNIAYETARTDLLVLVKLGLLLQQETGKSFSFIAADDLKTLIH